MTVDVADAVDVPLPELVPAVIAIVVVTVPDAEESVVDVEDGVQPMPLQDDVEEEATEVVVGEPGVTGVFEVGWLEVEDVQVGGGQPIPMPSNPSHDDDDAAEATELVVGEPGVTGGEEADWLEVEDVEVVSGQPMPMPSSPSHDDDDAAEVTELVAGEPELTGALETGWLEVGDEEGAGQPIPRPRTP